MRKTLAVSLCFILLLILTVTARAHSGRTDGNGGHTDHSTGEYHYHHGYSAHEHYDMDGDGDIDCPYEFDDKTDHSGGSGNSAHPTTEPRYTVIMPPPPTLDLSEIEPIDYTPIVRKESDIPISDNPVVAFFQLFLPLGILLCLMIINFVASLAYKLFDFNLDKLQTILGALCFIDLLYMVISWFALD